MQVRTHAEFGCPNGFTMIEVLVAALLVAIGLGSVLTMNVKTMRTLRATRQAAASSQLLQQRVEAIRGRAWPEVSTAAALALLMQSPTESEKELADAGVIELIEVSVPEAAAAGRPAAGARSFSIRRQRGTARIVEAGDFAQEPTLLFEDSVAWRDVDGEHERRLRTIVCRAGLTRSGIFGSALGRPRAASATP